MTKKKQEILLAGISVDPDSDIAMYRQLYESLRQAILQGRLRPGHRLPATRTLSVELGVSRNTVLLAFDTLLSEGYLKGKTGSGAYVSDDLPEKLLHAARPAAKASSMRRNRRTGSKRGKLMAAYAAPVGESRPFKHGMPALREFPFDVWSKLLTRQMRRLPYTFFGYGEAAGYRPLREAIATYLRTARAVHCEFEQIIVINGSQQALDLTARVLLDPGDKVWIEDPGYLGARKAFVGAGGAIVPVPIDQHGINVEKGKQLESQARLVHVTPSHQFPLGVTMSLSRRLQLLDWAAESNAWILEDDYDSEYRYSGRPLSSLQGLDSNERVIYMGTFSKVLFPAMRLGYLVVPPDLIDMFVSAKSVADRHSALLEQAALADFIELGYFGRHLRRMRLLYQQRQQALLEAVNQQLAGLMEMTLSDGGMHEIGWLPGHLDDKECAVRANDVEITAQPVSEYSLRYGTRPGLVLGYAAYNEAEIKTAVQSLATVLQY